MKPGPLPLKPSRLFVEHVLAEEAKRAKCSVEAMLAPGKPTHRVLKAKRSAIQRIVAETGCSARGLAAVWGLNPETVRTAMGPTPPPKHPYDLTTIRRLAWQHGEQRAREIVAGSDPATQADIEAWRRLYLGERRA